MSAAAIKERILHPLKPIFDKNSATLILGTMPSPVSRSIGFYYMHPQNRFWKVMAAVYKEKFSYDNAGTLLLPEKNSTLNYDAAIAERCSFILRHHLALWDVLRSCDITGASDTSIRNPVPNDFSSILKEAKITKVFCTGTTAYKLYTKLCAPVTGITAVLLPSTSPANQGRWSVDALVETYGRQLNNSL